MSSTFFHIHLNFSEFIEKKKSFKLIETNRSFSGKIHPSEVVIRQMKSIHIVFWKKNRIIRKTSLKGLFTIYMELQFRTQLDIGKKYPHQIQMLYLLRICKYNTYSKNLYLKNRIYSCEISKFYYEPMIEFSCEKVFSSSNKTILIHQIFLQKSFLHKFTEMRFI